MINKFFSFWKNNLWFLLGVVLFSFLFAFKYFFKLDNIWSFVFYLIGVLISLFLIWFDQNFLLDFYQSKDLDPAINGFLFILALPILLVLLLTSQSAIGFSIAFNIYFFIFIKMLLSVNSEVDFNDYFTKQLKRDLNSIEVKCLFGIYLVGLLGFTWIFFKFNF
jgi:hypothetical protein